jgi:type I restriction enzyme R subunit
LLGNETLRETFYRTVAQFSSNLQIALSSLRIYTSLGEQELDRFKADLKFWQELRRTVKLRYSDSVSMGEFETKMQKLMDQYIAAEEVIRITNPVDILNKEQFDEELARMGSDRAKADMIRTRMAKRIHEKMDEDPVYYKKFSERIEEALKQYKERRIGEAEYLKKMSEIMADMRKGNSGVTYPVAIQRMPHAQAFYGVVVAELNQNAEYDEPFRDVFATFSMEVEQIIRTHTKVDWHENQDVHKKIEQHIDDLIYAFEKKHQLNVPHDQAERLIENLKKVALRRF